MELEGRVWHRAKAHHNGHNLSIITETLSLSVYEPIAIQFCLGGESPKLGEGVELGGRVRYPAKVLRIRYNLFAGTETLSLSVYEPMQLLLGGTVPQFRERVELGGRVWCNLKVLHIMRNLFAGADTQSLSVYEPIAMQI